MKYLNLSGLTYFLNKIKTYLTSSTYLDSIGISNSDIDDIADDAGYSSGSLPASEDIYITGDIIPNTDNSVDLGASSKNIKMIYTKGITINGTQFLPSDYIPLSGTTSITGTGFFKSTSDSQLQIGSGTSTITGGCFVAYGSEFSNAEFAGAFRLRARTTRNYDLLGKNDGTLTWGTKNVAMQEDTVPRSGGAVMTGIRIARADNTRELRLEGGTSTDDGSYIVVYGGAYSTNRGQIQLVSRFDTSSLKNMWLNPDGTWTWNGTAVQITSDQRYKQQITEIDDKLLDAWQDVDLVQFKYNDAVDQKGKDKARLHTGYVVQQIDEACKSHGVDISTYGLYCHEEYPEETEEVEVEQADGTKKKETRVIREASEHYSLRYTEIYAIECAYLRRENSRLKENLASLEERLEKVEKSVNQETQEK